MALLATKASKAQVSRAAAVAAAFEIHDITMYECAVNRDRSKNTPPTATDVSIRMRSDYDEAAKSLVIEVVLELAGRDRDPEKAPSISVMAGFQLIYRRKSEQVRFSNADYEAFTAIRASADVWPYWREFVQSMTVRTGLPQLTMPSLPNPEFVLGANGKKGRGKGKSQSSKKSGSKPKRKA